MNFDDHCSKKIDDVSFESVIDKVNHTQPAYIPVPKSKEYNYKVIKEYGPLSESSSPLILSIVEWNNRKRFDVRMWLDNGEPGKGITFTTEEVSIMLSEASAFDYDLRRLSVIAECHRDKTYIEICAHVATLSTKKKNDAIWNKEINIVNWNRTQKVDIREWTNNYSEFKKGIRLTPGEMRRLIELLNTVEGI